VQRKRRDGAQTCCTLADRLIKGSQPALQSKSQPHGCFVLSTSAPSLSGSWPTSLAAEFVENVPWELPEFLSAHRRRHSEKGMVPVVTRVKVNAAVQGLVQAGRPKSVLHGSGIAGV
jgi:hypothetical protein